MIKEAAVSDKRNWKERRFRSKAGAVAVATIFVLASLSAVLAACGTDEDDSPTGAGESTGETNGITAEMQAEKDIIVKAVQTFFERTGRTEMAPREKPGPIGPWDVVPFKGDIEGIRLPTRYHYAWDAAGNITAVVEAPTKEE